MFHKESLQALESLDLAVLCAEIANHALIDDAVRIAAFTLTSDWQNLQRQEQELGAKRGSVRERMIDFLLSV